MTDRIKELEARVSAADAALAGAEGMYAGMVGSGLDATDAGSVVDARRAALIAAAEALGFEKAKQKAVDAVDRIPGGMLTPFAIRYDDAIAALRALDPEGK